MNINIYALIIDTLIDIDLNIYIHELFFYEFKENKNVLTQLNILYTLDLL